MDSIEKQIINSIYRVVVKDLVKKLGRGSRNVCVNVLVNNYPIDGKLTRDEYVKAYEDITEKIIETLKNIGIAHNEEED